MRLFSTASPSRVMSLAMVISLAGIVLPLSVHASQTAAHAPSPLASVYYIQHGLTVKPPNKRAKAGHTKQSLYTSYFLGTRGGQKASVKFHDGTYLHINQNTNLILFNPHTTTVTKGEVDEIMQPGTSHRIQTASAVASAIGTEFDVKEVTLKVKEKARGKKKKGSHPRFKKEQKTVITVVEGSLKVDTAKGSVTVKTNQQTSIIPGEAPKPPTNVDAAKITTWTKSLPPAKGRKENIALQDNGGSVVAFSSQATRAAALQGDAAQPAPSWLASFVNDGYLDRGWATAVGKTANEWVKIHFRDTKVYNLGGIVVDPAATQGLPSSDDAKHIELWTSITDSSDSSFTFVHRWSLQQKAGLQRLLLPKAVPARYMKLVVVDNFGGTQDAVAEVEAIAAPKEISPPVPTNTPTPAVPATATPTPTPVGTATPTVTPIPTATPIRPGFKFALHYTISGLPEPDNPAGGPDLDKTLTVILSGRLCGSNPYAQPFTVTEQYSLNDPSDNIFQQTTDTFQVTLPMNGTAPLTGDTSQLANETIQFVNGPTPQFAIEIMTSTGTPPDQTIMASVETDNTCPAV